MGTPLGPEQILNAAATRHGMGSRTFTNDPTGVVDRFLDMAPNEAMPKLWTPPVASAAGPTADDESTPDMPAFPMASMPQLVRAKALWENREIAFADALDSDMAQHVVSSLRVLASTSDADITILVDSPGGIVTGYYAIMGTMYSIAPLVNTTCLGMAASAGAMTLAMGTGVRSAFPMSEIMIHQPLGGAGGQASDIAIQAKHIATMRVQLAVWLAWKSGKDPAQVNADMLRDRWMKGAEALEYGLIDELVELRHGADLPLVPMINDVTEADQVLHSFSR